MDRNHPTHSTRRTSSSMHPIMLESSSPPGRPSWGSPTLSPEPRARKRRRLSTIQIPDEETIESIDLTEVEGPSALAQTLSKQREDAVRSQHTDEEEKGLSLLTAYKCPVCMDTPEDATSTLCGHLFCHKCIIDTLKYSEERPVDSAGKGPRGKCPVCRKPLTRVDAPGSKRNLIPLQLKLVTKKRNTITIDTA